MFDPFVFDSTAEKRSHDREQRGALRLALDPGEASLETLGLDGVEIVDVSVSGVGLMLPREFDQHYGELGGVLRLGERSAKVRLEPMRAIIDSDTRRLGARFIDPTNQTLKDLGDFLIEGFIKRERQLSHLWLAREKTLRFRSSKFVTDLLRHKALRQATPICVYRNMMPLHVRLFALKIDDEAGKPVLNAMPHGQDARNLAPGGPYDFVMAGKMAASIFSSSIIRVTKDSVLIEVPSEIRQCGFRESGRRKLSEAESIPVAILHSPNHDERIDGFLLDVSVGGFSFILQNGIEPLIPGDRIPRLIIDLPIRSLTVSAIVRRAATANQGSGRECGIEILGFSSERDGELWERFIFERLHPRLLVNTPNVVDAAWKLLDSSDYLQLWTPPARRRHLESEFVKSWRDVPSSIGHIMILVDGLQNIGTCAASRIYPRTWLLHSLGIDKEGRRRTRFFLNVTRELYDAILHLVQRSPKSMYFVVYAEKDKRWTNLLYGDFISAYTDQSRLLYDEYRLFRRGTASQKAVSGQVVDGVLRRLNGPQLRDLSSDIRRVITQMEFEAFSYSENEIDLGALHDAIQDRGLDRTRQAVVVYRADAPVAALITDIGDDGASVFGLLNRCRIFWFADPSDRIQIKQLLLAEAVDIYHAAGKAEFLYIDRDTVNDNTAASVGYDFVSEGVRWLAHMDVMPAWRSYVEEILGLRGGDRGTRRVLEHSGMNLDAV